MKGRAPSRKSQVVLHAEIRSINDHMICSQWQFYFAPSHFLTKLLVQDGTAMLCHRSFSLNNHLADRLGSLHYSVELPNLEVSYRTGPSFC